MLDCLIINKLEYVMIQWLQTVLITVQFLRGWSVFKNVISITMFQRETHLWPHYIWHRRWVVYVAYHMSFLTYIKYVYFMRQYSVIKLFSHSLEVLIALA